MGPEGMSTKLGDGYKGVIYDKDKIHEYKQSMKAILSSDKSDVVCRLMPSSDENEEGEWIVTKDKYELPMTTIIEHATIPPFLDVDADPRNRTPELRHDGGRSQWHMLNTKVYWLLKRTLKNGDHVLDSFQEGNGRAAWEKLIGGDEEFEVRMARVTKRLADCVCQESKEFQRFDGEMKQIKKEWNDLPEVQPGQSHVERRLTDSKYHADYLQKIFKPFHTAWLQMKINANLGQEDLETMCKAIYEAEKVCGPGSMVYTNETLMWNDQDTNGNGKGYGKGNSKGYGKGNGKGYGKGYSKGYGKGGYRYRNNRYTPYNGNGKGKGKGKGYQQRDRWCETCADFGDKGDQQRWRLAATHDTAFCSQTGGKYEGQFKIAKAAEKAAKFQSKVAHLINVQKSSQNEQATDFTQCMNVQGLTEDENDNANDGELKSEIEQFKQDVDKDDSMDGICAQLVNAQLMSKLSKAMGTNCAVMDTGTNKHHSFNDKKWFPEGTYEVSPKTALCASNHTTTITQMGTAWVKLTDVSGKQRVLSFKDCTFQPELPANLMCVDKLLFRGDTPTQHHIDFQSLKFKLNHGTSNEFSINMERKCSLPLLRITPMTPKEVRALRSGHKVVNPREKRDKISATLVHVNSTPMTWQSLHDKLGHPNDEYLKKVVKHSMLKNIPKLGMFPTVGVKPLCDSCHIGEQQRRQVMKTSTRPIGDYELFVDMGEPWPITSKQGNKLWMLIRERKRGYLAIYFLSTSSDVTDVFEQFLIDTNDKRKQLGMVHVDMSLIATDDDRVFISKKFKNLVRSLRIKQVVMPPYAHHLMGAVEGYMKHVKQGTIKLIHQSGLPAMLWDELMNAYVYARNRSFTSVCNEESHSYQSPHVRMFPGDVPDAKLLVTMGAKTYVYIDKNTRGVGDKHSWVGYMCGYSNTTGAYRVYDPLRNHVYDAFHVRVCDSVLYKDEHGPAREEEKALQERAKDLREYDLDCVNRMTDSPLKHFCSQVIVGKTPPTNDRVAPSIESDDGTSAMSASSKDSSNIKGKLKRVLTNAKSESPSRKSKRLTKGQRKVTYADQWTAQPDSEWGTTLCNIIEHQVQHEYVIEDMCFNMIMTDTASEVAAYNEPNSIHDAWAREGEQGVGWRVASDEEINWMVDKGVVEPVNRQQYLIHNVLSSGWTFRTKRDKNNKVTRQRARFFPKGCSQVMWHDFHPNSTASPVMRKSSLMMLFVITANEHLFTRSIDLAKAFFTGDLEETVISALPPGYRDDPKYAVYGKDTVWLYKKAAYGLRQAAHNFHVKYVQALLDAGYKRCLSDTCVLIRRDDDDVLIIGLWVDDHVVSYSSPKMLEHLYQSITNAGYEYTDEGEWSKILGMNVRYDREKGEIVVSHAQYIKKLLYMLGLEKLPLKSVPVKTTMQFSLADCADAVSAEDYKLFRTLLGGLGHVARWTHPELSFGVSQVSQVMNSPGKKHLEYLKDIAGYIHNACEKVLTVRCSTQSFEGNHVYRLLGLTDADYAGCTTKRRSRSGMTWFMDDNLIGSASKMQKTVSLSTAEAEYVAMVHAITFGKWAMSLLSELGFEYEKPVRLLGDNMAANVIVSHANTNHRYTKHIDIKMRYCKEIVRSGEIDVVYTNTNENVADIMTKALPKGKFVKFRDILLHQVPVDMYPDEGQIKYSLKKVFTEVDDDIELEHLEIGDE